MAEKQEILFEPFAKQQEFIDAAFSGKYSFITFGGAIRGGKSYGLLATFILLSKIFPGSRWAIVRKDLPTIKKNLYPSWDKIKPTKFIKSHNHDTHEVTFKNDSKIIFFPESFDTDKDLNRWRGLEVNGFGFEEINECQQQSLFKAFERAGSYIIKNAKVQPKPIVLSTCNPTNGWFKDLVYEPFKNGTLRTGWHYIQSRIYDNLPLLKEQPDYLPSLQANLNRYEFEVFVEGNWDIQLKTGGEFYKCFELNKHVKPVNYNPDIPLHISWDDNVNPYLPCGIFQIEGKTIKMIDEISGITPGNTVKSVCQEFVRRYPSHKSGLFIYGDATANKQDTKLEKGYNFFRLIMDNLAEYKPTNRVLASNPSVVMRGNWINTVFEKNYGDLTFIIGENCRTAINDFILLKEASDGTKLKEMGSDPKTGARFQKVGHYTDLFDYVMCSAFSEEFLKYQRGGKTFTPYIGKNNSRNMY